MMIPSIPGKTAVSVRLPLSFIGTGLASLLLGQLLLLFNGDLLMDNLFRGPAMWMAAHFLVLGWGMLVAMGTMYQLVPVTFQTPLYSERLGFVQFWITTAGTVLLAMSLGFYPSLAREAGGLVLAGALLFLIQMALILLRQKERDLISLFVSSALISLFVTLLAGLILAISISGAMKAFLERIGAGFLFPINHEALFISHMLLGLVGWFTLLIMGFSYKMVPMFALSHGFSMKPSYWVYGLYTGGLLTTLTGIWTGGAGIVLVGFVLLLTGFTLFSFHIREILRKRMKKQLDKGFVFALLAIGCGWLIHLASVLVLLLPVSKADSFAVIVYGFVMIWISFSMMGYLFKIIPFLWWTHRFSHQVGQDGIPTLKDMVDERSGKRVFLLLAAAVAGVMVSLISGIQLLFTISQVLVVLSILRYIQLIVGVLKK